MNKEESHVLVGIVSQRLGESCNQQDYSTSVSALKQWIESSIKENGGMASCGIDFSALLLEAIPPFSDGKQRKE